jgi:hypothetical protein
MKLNESQIRELIEEAKYDEVGLWLILSTVQDELGINEPQSLRQVVMNTVKVLLDSGEVVAGYYKSGYGDVVIKWNMDTATVLAKIEMEWDQLGREPNIGDIVVFIGKEGR